MRLFIGVSFDDKTKELIYNQELILKKHLVSGHITDINNIHLTIIFIGETDNTKEIIDSIEKIDVSKFDIFLKGIKYFNRGNQRLYYLDVRKNQKLSFIYDVLFNSLKDIGFFIEDRTYKPHVTLGREVVLDEDVYLEPLNKIVRVNKISLMESKRINGKLEYVELYAKKLREN